MINHFVYFSTCWNKTHNFPALVTPFIISWKYTPFLTDNYFLQSQINKDTIPYQNVFEIRVNFLWLLIHWSFVPHLSVLRVVTWFWQKTQLTNYRAWWAFAISWHLLNQNKSKLAGKVPFQNCVRQFRSPFKMTVVTKYRNFLKYPLLLYYK